MKKIKHIIAFVMLVFLCFNIPQVDSRADGVSVIVAFSANTVSVGNSVSVTVSVSGSDMVAYEFYVSYNSSVLQYTGGGGSNQGSSIKVIGYSSGSVTLNFTAIASGSCGISTSGKAYDINYSELAVSHAGGTITVNGGSSNTGDNTNTTTESQTTTTTATTEDDGKSDNCNLVSLNVAPGTLEPKFAYNVTNYTLQVDKDVTSIAVTPEVEDKTAKFVVSGAEDLQIGENVVKVVVTAENGYSKTYTINVAVGPLLENVEITVDGVKYSIVNSPDDLEAPESFTTTTMTYKDWEILAYESPNKLIQLVALKTTVTEDVDGEEKEVDKISWFMYDEVNDAFVPYVEIASSQNRFVILPVPDGVEVPDYYVEKEVTVQGQKVVAYQSEYSTDKNIFLVYANNINGSEGFYLYDRTEGAFLRYCPDDQPEPVIEEATKTDATPTDVKPQNVKKVKDDEGFFTKKVLSFILYGVSALLLLFITLFFVQIGKKRELREDLEQAESMVEQLTTAKNADKADATKMAAVANDTVKEEVKDIVENVEAEVKNYDFIPEISLVNYEEESNALKESMKDNYDANLDSAFPEDAVTAAETAVEETKSEAETVVEEAKEETQAVVETAEETVSETVEEKVEEVTEKTDEA